jgi:hypothetical protein
LWSIIQAVYSGSVSSQWDPITLKGAGLFHMAMGAVLGIAAWSRGQEKLMGVNVPQTNQIEESKITNQNSAVIRRPKPSSPVDSDYMPPKD